MRWRADYLSPAVKPEPQFGNKMSEVYVPNRNALINPVLRAVHDLGGSGTNQEIHDKVVSNLGLSDEQVAKPIKPGASGPAQLAHRLGWARSDLKAIGLLINSVRGVWSLTEKGKSTNEVDGNEVRRAVNEMIRQEKERNQVAQPSEIAVDDEELTGTVDTSEYAWREELHAVIKDMDATAFERLCQRILRESGFAKVEVTKASHDGGIDGKGILQVSDFLTFRVVFQCKRYSGSVGPDAVQKLRGAMPGSADRGLIVTTGYFTQGAIREAAHEHKSPIELVDGDELINKLKELELGVSTVMVEEVTVDPDFFANI